MDNIAVPCAWCGNEMVLAYALRDDQYPFCSEECWHRFVVVHRRIDPNHGIVIKGWMIKGVIPPKKRGYKFEP